MADTCLPAVIKFLAAGAVTEAVRRTVTGLSGVRAFKLDDCRINPPVGAGLNPAGLGGTAGRWLLEVDGLRVN